MPEGVLPDCRHARQLRRGRQYRNRFWQQNPHVAFRIHLLMIGRVVKGYE